MRFNFKKIAAIGTSVLLTGMSMGFAAAASYPAPFVSGGVANVGIVYGTGTGVSSLDGDYASDISANLATYVSGGGAVTTSGEVVSLDTSGDRIWLNTSLNSVKSTFTKSDLPTVLADYTFSGDVTSKVTTTLKLVTGNPAGGENSGKVIFAKQPSSNDDPVIGVSLGSSQTSYPLYNASATMAAITFNHSDSEGEEIELFGQSFTISSETNGDNIVLLKEAEKVDLALPSNPSATVTVDGSTYTVTLVTASATVATVTITNSAGVSQTKDVTEATSKRINGIDVAVTRASTSSLESVGESASIIVGSQKVTLTHASIVTIGEDNDPIDGTYVYITGGPSACTEIAIAVFRPDSTNDVILPGESFVDPVFGNFKMDFAGLNSPLTATDRDMIYVYASGEDTMTVKFTEEGGNEKQFDFAHNESSLWVLGDDSNYKISVREGENLTYASTGRKYVVVGNDDYGHLLELYDVYNQTSGTGAITSDRVKFRDVMTTETHETTFSSTEGSGTMDIDGKRYTVTFRGTGEDAIVNVKYPTSDAAVTELVVFPTIQTKGGSKVMLYEPLTFNLTGVSGLDTTATLVTKLWLPDGDGYSGVTLTSTSAGTPAQWNWSVTGGAVTAESLNLTLGSGDFVDFKIGEIGFNLTAGNSTASYSGAAGASNQTTLWITDLEADTAGTGANINQPGLLIYEGKDDNSEYHAVFVDLEDAAASMGTSTNPVGVNDVLFTNTENYHTAASWASDSDITQDMDWYGTLTTMDANTASQKTVTISLPTSQVYAQLYFSEASASVSGEAGDIGDVIYKDTEVSSASTKNLIVVGGSCINSVAATLVGGAYCGSEWTTATGVGSGQFLIKSYDGGSLTSGIAVLVAGYEVADTLNAATYLMNKKPSVTVGDKWIGTTSTSATLQVS